MVTETRPPIVIEDWPLAPPAPPRPKPDLPPGAREAIRLLRENPRGFGEHRLHYFDFGDGECCAVGVLRDGKRPRGDTFDEYDDLAEQYGFTSDGARLLDHEFTNSTLTFSQMADHMSENPERYFEMPS